MEFSTFILILFSILAAYLMWIHFSLINRDFKQDLATAFKEGSEPLFNDIRSWINNFKKVMEYQSEKTLSSLHAQREEIDKQTRIIIAQSDHLKSLIASQNDYIRQLHEERQHLQNELSKTQNILNKTKRKLKDES